MGWYDAFSNVYDASLEKLYAEHRELAAAALALQPGMSVLDLPYGTGQSLPAIARGLRGSGAIVGADLSAGMLRLVAKLEAIVPAHMRPFILEPAASVAPVSDPPVEAVSSADLRAAVRSGHKLAIGYRGADGVASERVVWPVLLGYRDAGRILAAYCELRGDFRYFRTERMTSARVLKERYPERPAALRARWRKAMDKERERFRTRKK